MDESIFERLDRVTTERDEARADVKRLWALNQTRVEENEKARAEVERLKQFQFDWNADADYLKAQTNLAFKQRDQAREELQLLKQERDLWQQVQRNEATAKESLTVRPEPSRLEIAATVMAGLGFFEDVTHDAKLALRAADALIAAAKEGK